MKANLILNTDSYKSSHPGQYPPGTDGMYSYLESRGGHYGETLFFGLQYLLKEYFTSPVTQEDVEEAAAFMAGHGLPFPREGWERVVKVHGGFLPVKICAVPEGSVVTTRNVLMTVESTDPQLFWLPGWIETMMVRLWYPITVATQSWHIRRIIKEALDKTSNDPSGELPFKLHDFGSRGVSSRESAGIGGMAHLVSFQGSDTVEGVRFANHYYRHAMAAFSIPACYDSETEILTPTGWVKFPDLKDQDQVAQYHTDGTITFTKPSAIHVGSHQGEMVRFYTKSKQGKVNLLVTPNHRMIRRSLATNKIEVLLAESFTGSQRNEWLQAGMKLEGSRKSLTALEAFQIAFQADGSYASHSEDYTGSRSGCLPVRFSLKKDRKKERLEVILSELGFEYNKSPQKRHGYVQYWIKVPVSLKMEKVFTDWVDLRDVSFEWCQDFLEEAALWDGTNKASTICYTSTVESNVDVVQAIGTLAGWRTGKSTATDPRGDRKPTFLATCVRSTVSRECKGIYHEATQFSGEVFCVTVPSGMVVVRRDGCVSVSGNSEHSTITSWGKTRECDAYRNMVEKFGGPGKLVAVVSDSYDLWNAIERCWTEDLRTLVEESGGTVVIRPDSGVPVEVVLRCLETLERKVGMTTNLKGFKVLPACWRLIQGDGVNETSIREILHEMTSRGYSASNIAFGMGGALLQQVNRDTQRFAYKCSEVTVGGVSVPVFKDPVDDPGKASKKGRLNLVHRYGKWATLPEGTIAVPDNLLRTVYQDGKLLVDDSLEVVRGRAAR